VPPDQLKRKLAVILSADVKGYSRLMGEDEEWTLWAPNTGSWNFCDCQQFHLYL